MPLHRISCSAWTSGHENSHTSEDHQCCGPNTTIALHRTWDSSIPQLSSPGAFWGVVGTIRVALFSISFWFSHFDFFKLRYSSLFSLDSRALCLFLSPVHASISFFPGKLSVTLRLSSVFAQSAFAAETCENSFL